MSQSTLETWHNITPANWVYDLETNLVGAGPDSVQISGTVYSLSTPDSGNRLVMVLAKEDSIRDVIAFPKTQQASCLQTAAPAQVDPKQLKELQDSSLHKQK
jgi:hypothetical protein